MQKFSPPPKELGIKVFLGHWLILVNAFPKGVENEPLRAARALWLGRAMKGTALMICTKKEKRLQFSIWSKVLVELRRGAA